MTRGKKFSKRKTYGSVVKMVKRARRQHTLTRRSFKKTMDDIMMSEDHVEAISREDFKPQYADVTHDEERIRKILQL